MKNNKTLLIIFLILSAIFIASRIFDRPTSRSFDKELITVDTSKVNGVIIYPKQNGPTIHLLKNADGWRCESDGISSPAAKNAIQSVLSAVATIEPKRLVARTSEKFSEFGVTENEGTRIEVTSGNRSMSDFIIGRFSFNQQTRQPLSYIRKSDSEDTYVVEGFLGLTFDQSFDNFRDKTVLRIGTQSVEQISLNENEMTIKFLKMGNSWTANGIAVDSVAMSQYLNGISNANGSTFYNTSESFSDIPIQTLTVSDSDGQNVQISLYTPENSGGDFVVHSSLNETSYFASDSSGLYKTLFQDLMDMVTK